MAIRAFLKSGIASLSTTTSSWKKQRGNPSYNHASMHCRDPPQGALLPACLDSHVLPTFWGRVLAVYTAVARGITVVSLNVANFESSGGLTLDPCNNT